MKRFLAIAGVSCLLLYWILSVAFDAVQASSREGVIGYENNINEVIK